MKQPRSKTAIETAAEQLRAMTLAAPDGALLGSEEALISSLSVSRVTFLQAARLLEREGFLRVRRGIAGGYFSARPTADTIERSVSAYLDTLDMDMREMTLLATVLWVEAVRKLASHDTPQAKALAERFQKKLKAIKPDCRFSEISAFEMEYQSAVFELIKSRYMELIFRINIAFARKHIRQLGPADDSEAHLKFARSWHHAKQMELIGIGDADPELAVVAARHARNLLHDRVWVEATPPDTLVRTPAPKRD